MAVVAEIENLDRLIAKLKALAEKQMQDQAKTVVVGFTQEYALYVHEDMEAYHPVGQAKYLEQPARELSNGGTLARIVTAVVRQGRPMGQGLLLAGLRLQREAQALTPVDTGALRASAFTKVE